MCVCVCVCVCVFVLLSLSESSMSVCTRTHTHRRPMLSETAWESCIFNVTSQTANNVRRAEPCGGGEEEEEEEDGGGNSTKPGPFSLCNEQRVQRSSGIKQTGGELDFEDRTFPPDRIVLSVQSSHRQWRRSVCDISRWTGRRPNEQPL